MATNQPSLLIAVVDHAAIVKVKGRANFTTSVTFKRLVSELHGRGMERLILDLTDCVTMDSTFLGVLAATALRLANAEANPQRNGSLASQNEGTQLRLLNPNQRVADLLDNLGVSELFRTIHSEAPVADHELSPAEELKPSREELSLACLEAHQLLMDLNPANIPKFKDVAQFIAEDLKK
jgi:anti-sigma B factor antagonist